MLLSPMNPLSAHFNHVDTSAALSLQSGDFPHMPASKRPKLSLQTNALSTSYGSSASATGNKATDMTAATPTTLNTFNNTFDLTVRPSPTSATASPFRTQTIASPLRRKQPYSLNLPLGLKPILKNSRLATEFRRPSLTASASPRVGRRVFFPTPKKVSFQFGDETIVTHKYTARHADLSSESSDNDSAESDAANDQKSAKPTEVAAEMETETEADFQDIAVDEHERTLRHRLSSRGISRVQGRRERSTSTQRRKKRRRWQWTLTDIEEVESSVKQGSPDKAVGAESTVPVVEDEAVSGDITAIAASVPLPPDSETNKSESRPGHVSAMVKRFEGISSDEEPCI